MSFDVTLHDLNLDFSDELAPRPVQVWKPSDWDRADVRAVLIMHDGQNLFFEEDSFDGIWGVVPALERLRNLDAIPATAVAGVWNGGRRRFPEYMPLVKYPDHPLWRELAEEHKAKVEDVTPVSRAYASWIVTAVLPAVARFLGISLTDVPVHTMGSSMGGLISMELLFRHSKVFTGAGCLSTHWSAADDPTVDYFIPLIPDAGNNRLYMDFGTEDLDEEYEPFQNRFDRALNEKGWKFSKDYVSYKFFGADHSEKAWRRRLEVPLTYLLGG